MPRVTPTSGHPPLSWMASLRWPIVQSVLGREARSSTVLEPGCGQGAIGSRLAEMFDGYVGVEPDEQSRTVARTRVEPLGGTVVADLADAPDLRADVLCAFEVLEHIEDDLGALRAWLTRARPGALAVFSVPADPHRFSTTDELVGHYRRYTDDGLAQLLRDAGLEQVHLRRYGMPLGYALEDVRDLIARRKLAGTAQDSMDSRSHGSGRLLQPTRAWERPVRRALTAPFLLAQDVFPRRGPCLVGWARVPA